MSRRAKTRARAIAELAAPARRLEQKSQQLAPDERVLSFSPGQKVSRFYPVDGIDPRRLREILRMADLGMTFLLMELLDDVASDSQVETELQKMKLPIAGAPIVVEPGEDSDKGREIAEAGAAFLARIPAFTQLKADLLDAEFRGFAAVQPIWTSDGSAWWVEAWQAIETRFFRFAEGDIPLIQTATVPSGEPLPPGIIFHAVRDKAGLILRGGCARSVLKPWLYKGYALVDGMSFLERFGQPHVQVELAPNIKEGSPEMERAKSAAESIIADNYALVPPGVAIRLLETVKGAATVRDIYLAVVEFCDSAISKAINGQTLTTQAGPTGSRAQAQVHQDVMQELKEARARRLDECLNRLLLWPWTIFHYGPKAPKPLLRHLVEKAVDKKALAEEQKVRAETMAIATQQIGVKVTDDDVRTQLGLSTPEEGQETVGGEPGPESSLAHRRGACPGCGAEFSLAAAEKKKRAVGWVA